MAGCGLLTMAGLAGAPRMKLAGNPVPSAGQLQAAQNTVNQRAADLGRAEERLAAADARLTDLETRAGILTEDYDGTVVAEQQAHAAQVAAVRRLAAAEIALRGSHRRVADIAAAEFETQGGFDPMAAMLGDSRGVLAYLGLIGLGQVFARNRTDILAENTADSVVAGVFRAEASAALRQKQADVRQAAALKMAIQAAVTRQLAAVTATRSMTSRLTSLLQNAKLTGQSVAATRQAALAAEAAQAARQRAAAASTASASPPSFPDAPAGSRRGNIAAGWALSQIGLPYQWGAAGPSSYDCSGLTMAAWARAGVGLLHYAGDQWVEGAHVPLSSLERGDLLFYATDNADLGTIHHVGIYIGGGSMVDAPYTGADVRIDDIYAPGVPIGAVRP